MTPPTRQRSFRLSEGTLALLGQRARERGESTNALASRLIEEGLRTERHPLVWFRDGAAGRRPALMGTRLDVADVIAYLRENDDPREVAELLEISVAWVDAAARYAQEFPDEIEQWLDAQRQVGQRR